MKRTHRIDPVDTFPRNAWLRPDGALFYVDDYGHADVAIDDFNDITGGDILEENGWLHLSCNRPLYVTCTHPQFRQPQLDTLWDIYAARPDHPITWQVAAIGQLRRLLSITVQES